MGGRSWAIGCAALGASVLAGGPAQGTPGERAVPYWASISAGQARMRTGPGRNFPAAWIYRRADLPVRVIEVFPSWRKIEDPNGVQGWVLVNLLSDRRTAIITADLSPLRSEPDDGAAINWRAQHGVVGRISQCADGWCLFDVQGRKGYVRTTALWGVAPGETVD